MKTRRCHIVSLAVSHLLLFIVLSSDVCRGAADVGPYIKIAKEGDGWWFAQGTTRFLSFGVNYVSYVEYWPDTPIAAQRKAQGYYDVQGRYTYPYTDWAAATETRLQGWGVNTLGSWSAEVIQNRSLYGTAMLPLPAGVDGNCLIDVFVQDFDEQVDKLVKDTCTQQRTNTKLIGYFIGNELPWYGDHGWPDGSRTLFNLYQALPVSAPGRQALLAFLQQYYGSWTAFRKDFSTAGLSWTDLQNGAGFTPWSLNAGTMQDRWAGVVADRFFKAYADKIRAYDANHLILGARFASRAPYEVWIAAGKYCDIHSVNYYTATYDAALARWRSVYAATAKPILITETSWRATQNRSNNLNTVGVDCTVATQLDRAACLVTFGNQWLNEPYMLGIHWFEYFDEPPGGRYSGGGENSNYGLVDIKDVQYEEVTGAFAKVASTFKTSRPAPTAFPNSVDKVQFGGPTMIRPFDIGIPMQGPVLAWDSRQGGTSYVSLDKDKGAAVTVVKDATGMTCALTTGTGWSPTIVLQSKAIRSSPNARYLELKLNMTSGKRFRICLSEQKRPEFVADVIIRLQVTLPGVDSGTVGNPAADGERFLSPYFTGTGELQTIVLDLWNTSLDRNQGNQQGDNSLGIPDLDYIGIIVPSNQGNATMSVDSLRWTPGGANYSATPAP